LVEVVVAAVILAILATVTVPSLMTFLDRQRATTTATQLSGVATGIVNFEAAIHSAGTTTNNDYPFRISDLVTAITANDSTSCKTKFTANAVTQWAAAGPFVNFYAAKPAGLSTPLGTLQDTITRNPLSATAGFLELHFVAIDSADAVMLDEVVDNGDGGTLGTVRYTIGTTSAHHADVLYLIPALAKC
jgi:Tfp pilus assembly protein PilE